jgi:hypothetical protein
MLCALARVGGCETSVTVGVYIGVIAARWPQSGHHLLQQKAIAVPSGIRSSPLSLQAQGLSGFVVADIR